MSADNYYRICKHPTEAGKFAAVMGFASNEERVEPDEKSIPYDSVKEAYDAARKDPIIEYGIQIDPDCLEVVEEN
ncbi:hypothetical protein GMA3_80 [Gordonia phage GMA3]|uniref:Uncharacterized protein n=1 Tax=Gordonia phage GMA3 TaxID=1647284 RepID=A0A0K0NL31_9CAUD|nr:hypothetical protein AU105_gp080 [Gordonia phage GMA3]AKL88257.1 hypothetical protein GMA3_80 [Gordonia phage GMA3]